MPLNTQNFVSVLGAPKQAEKLDGSTATAGRFLSADQRENMRRGSQSITPISNSETTNTTQTPHKQVENDIEHVFSEAHEYIEPEPHLQVRANSIFNSFLNNIKPSPPFTPLVTTPTVIPTNIDTTLVETTPPTENVNVAPHRLDQVKKREDEQLAVTTLTDQLFSIKAPKTNNPGADQINGIKAKNAFLDGIINGTSNFSINGISNETLVDTAKLMKMLQPVIIKTQNKETLEPEKSQVIRLRAIFNNLNNDIPQSLNPETVAKAAKARESQIVTRYTPQVRATFERELGKISGQQVPIENTEHNPVNFQKPDKLATKTTAHQDLGPVRTTIKLPFTPTNNDLSIEARSTFFNQNLSEKYNLVQTRDDGNSLFRAISAGLAGNPYSIDAQLQHKNLRIQATEYMNNHKTEFNVNDEYLLNIRHSGNPGGEQEIIAMAKLLKQPIVLHYPDPHTSEMVEHTFSGGEETQNKQPLHISFVNGNHFDLIIPKSSSQTESNFNPETEHINFNSALENLNENMPGLRGTKITVVHRENPITPYVKPVIVPPAPPLTEETVQAEITETPHAESTPANPVTNAPLNTNTTVEAAKPTSTELAAARIPLNKLQANMFSHKVPQLNRLIDQFVISSNVDIATLPQIHKKEKHIRLQVEALQEMQGLINSKADWGNRGPAIDRLEKAIITQLNYFKSLAVEVEETKAGGTMMGPTARRNVTPSRWVNDLRISNNAPLDIGTLSFLTELQKGAQGTPLVYESADKTKKYVGKVDRTESRGEVEKEFLKYKLVYEQAGMHPNLANVHGMADLRYGNQHEIGMLMDKIPGMDGKGAQVALRNALDDGVISHTEYWGAMQYIENTLLDLTQHLAKAGLSYNDFKPDNYVINSETGSLILIDLGGASKTGALPGAITDQYVAPEIFEPDSQKVKTGTSTVKSSEVGDVFTIGASLVHSVEMPDLTYHTASPNQGITETQTPFTIDRDGNKHKKTFETGNAQTAYRNFLDRTMDRNPETRANSRQAQQTDFISDRLLSDTDACKVLKGVISGTAREDWQKKWLAAAAKNQNINIDNLMPLPLKDWDKAILETLTPAIPATKARVYMENINEILGKIDYELKRSPRDISSFSALINLTNKAKQVCVSAEEFGTDLTQFKKDISTAEQIILTRLQVEIPKKEEKYRNLNTSDVNFSKTRDPDFMLNRNTINMFTDMINSSEILNGDSSPPKIDNTKLKEIKNRAVTEMTRSMNKDISNLCRDLGKVDFNNCRAGYLEGMLNQTKELIRNGGYIGVDTNRLAALQVQMINRLNVLRPVNS
jgi:serine/threonine protein kinase